MRAIVILPLLLAGCVSYGKQHMTITEGIASLKGQPLDAAIAKLGLPSSNMPLEGDTVYVWTNGNVYSGVPGDTAELKCEVRLRVGADKRIVGGNWDGNNGACTRFAQAFR